MQWLLAWWRRKRHEKEFFKQLRGMAKDISPARIETEVITLIKGLFHHDPVIQGKCFDLLRGANSRTVAQALRSYIPSEWWSSFSRYGMKATKFYQKVVDLFSGEQNSDTVEMLIMLTLVGQGSVRESAMGVLRQVSAPHLVEHGMLIVLSREHELTKYQEWSSKYLLGTVLAALMVFVYMMTFLTILPPKFIAASFAFFCMAAGLFTWLQVSAQTHALRDQQQVLLLLMQDFLQKQGGSAALRDYVAQRIEHLQRKLKTKAAGE